MSGLEIKGAFVFKSSRRPNNCIYIVDMKTTAANDTNMESARVKPAKPLLFFCIVNYASL